MDHNTSQPAAADAPFAARPWEPRSPTDGPNLYPEITGPLTAHGLETYVQQARRAGRGGGRL